MPHLMNCAHQGKGWCLDCVKTLHDSTAPPAFVWTDAKPTVPGWWWWERSPTAGVEIVQVTIGVRLIADIGGRYHPISELPGRWSGPIPHPADAREGGEK